MPTPKSNQIKSPEPSSHVSPKQLPDKLPKAEAATALPHDTFKGNKLISPEMPQDHMESGTEDFNVAKLSMKVIMSLQPDFNGSNTFGTMKISSRHGSSSQCGLIIAPGQEA